MQTKLIKEVLTMIYYIGIDISKYKHDFCIISNTGEVIVENSSFDNNKKGFQELLEKLKPYDKSNIRIAFEATTKRGEVSRICHLLTISLYINMCRIFFSSTNKWY